MSEDRPLAWEDLIGESREYAIRTVMRVARRTRSDSEELVNAAAMKLMSPPRVASNPRSLLATTALHDLYSGRRRDFGSPILPPSGGEVDSDGSSSVHEGSPDLSTDPIARLIADEDQSLRTSGVQDVLHRLSMTDRALLTSHYFEGRSLADIDRDQEEPSGTAKVRLHRARRRFRALLERSGEKPEWAR